MRAGDLESKRLIVLKGLLFLFLALGGAAGVLIQSLRIETALLLAICVWGSCRFYYFLFYVLQNYVDPNFKYRGIFDALLMLLRKPKQ